jgi:hypothetical protein
MSRSEEFRESALYHGTAHPFQIGDVVTPMNMGVAFAASDPRAASIYSSIRSHVTGKPARLFQVQPIEGDDTVEQKETRTGHVIATSKKGFKVVSEEEPSDTDPVGGKLKYGNGKGGKS